MLRGVAALKAVLRGMTDEMRRLEEIMRRMLINESSVGLNRSARLNCS